MSRRWYIGLFLAGLLVALLSASLERYPGYMDADYYYAGAMRLVSGQGGSEPYLWNYLNAPKQLPAPSFSYWMPLVSLLAAGGLYFAPGLGWWGARLGFLLLAACIPPLTGLLSFRLTRGATYARLAGILALFPGFYLPYLTTTDAFPIYMVLGVLFLLLTGELLNGAVRRTELALFGLGLLAGLLHLTRADGLIWLAAVGCVALAAFMLQRRAGSLGQGGALRLVAFGLAALLGYSLVMSPWLFRNLGEWGSLLPPGGSRALWITEYDQTMIYPASLLTPQHWLAAGWDVHFRARLNAFGNHLQSAVAVQGGIILFPFILAGLWKLRGCWPVRLAALMWLVTLGLMTLVFPYAGINGGFFHSGAALQPLFWAVVPVGVESIMLWYAQKRRMGWPAGMVRFMSVLLVLTGLLLSGLLYFQRVAGSQAGVFQWSASAKHYQQVEQALVGQGAQPGDGVLVNNPPGYWLASCRPAVVIPNGDEQMLLAVARQYNIRYLVLETTNPVPLGDLYHERVNPPELTYLTSVSQTRLYRIDLSR